MGRVAIRLTSLGEFSFVRGWHHALAGIVNVDFSTCEVQLTPVLENLKSWPRAGYCCDPVIGVGRYM